MYEELSSSFDWCELAIGVFLDLSKAFDTVHHNILVDKLKYNGICGLALEWLKRDLTNRLQIVEFSAPSSSYHSILCGVPQGSILGPLLFLLYINDLNNVSKLIDLVLFADDSHLFLSHKHSDVLAVNTLTSGLEKLSHLFKANKLSQNLKKGRLNSCYLNQDKKGKTLRAAACKDREFAVNDQFGESLIFCPKIPFGELFSKIIFKNSSDFLILRDSEKFENAVKVRFFGQLKVQNKVRERSTAKCLK